MQNRMYLEKRARERAIMNQPAKRARGRKQEILEPLASSEQQAASAREQFEDWNEEQR